MNISFIIPTYNAADTLASCLFSILRESHPLDEIIVVDNGSCDQSVQIANSFDGVRVYHKPDCNVSAVRNYGAQKASHDIIAFIDSDCLLIPGWRDNALKILDSDHIHATGCKYVVPENSNNWIEAVWFSQRCKGQCVVSYINSGNLVLKRHVFVKTGGFDENLITGEDAEFCFRLRSLGFNIVSSDLVGAVHLGNPKTIYDFYKKQYWHSLGMFGTYRINKFDKPIIATFLFILCLVSSFILIYFDYLVLAIILPFTIPFMAATFRARRYRLSIKEICLLIILYCIYFVARSVAFLKIVFGQMMMVMIKHE